MCETQTHSRLLSCQLQRSNPTFHCYWSTQIATRPVTRNQVNFLCKKEAKATLSTIPGLNVRVFSVE